MDILIPTPKGVIHNAECKIDLRPSVEEKVYNDAGISVLDLNRIFPNWDQKIISYVAARWPKERVPTELVVRQAIIIGMCFAVEEIMRQKI